MTNWWQLPIINNFGQYPDPEGKFAKPDINILSTSIIPFTAPVSGTVTGIDTTSSYGDVVTVQMDNQYNSVAKYFAFLHLYSIAPNLQVGQHVSANTILGYGGGGNSRSGAMPGFALTDQSIYGSGSVNEPFSGSYINPLLDPTNFFNSLSNGPNQLNLQTSQSNQTGQGTGNIILDSLGLPSAQDLRSFIDRFMLVFLGIILLVIGLIVVFFSSDSGKKVEQGAMLAA